MGDLGAIFDLRPVTLRICNTAFQKRQLWLTIGRRQQPTTTVPNHDGIIIPNGGNH